MRGHCGDHKSQAPARAPRPGHVTAQPRSRSQQLFGLGAPVPSEQTRPRRPAAQHAHHGGMALSVLVILLLAVLYESIKVGKARLLYQALMNLSIPTSQQLIEETDQDSSSSDSLPVSRSPLRWFLCHFGQSLLHVAQVVVGYFMMLAVMSYNTWIFFGVVLGSGVGYYLAYPLLNMT
uniref:Copper transport protein n=1 Tax=Capra hircus TaxID=9925 RepID=A0A8C2R191_CAPHI